jgi:hypothetical protein
MKALQKSSWDGKGIEKRILSLHHPSTLVRWCVLLHSGRTKPFLPFLPLGHRVLQHLPFCGGSIVGVFVSFCSLKKSKNNFEVQSLEATLLLFFYLGTPTKKKE